MFVRIQVRQLRRENIVQLHAYFSPQNGPDHTIRCAISEFVARGMGWVMINEANAYVGFSVKAIFNGGDAGVGLEILDTDEASESSIEYIFRRLDTELAVGNDVKWLRAGYEQAQKGWSE